MYIGNLNLHGQIFWNNIKYTDLTFGKVRGQGRLWGSKVKFANLAYTRGVFSRAGGGT